MTLIEQLKRIDDPGTIFDCRLDLHSGRETPYWHSHNKAQLIYPSQGSIQLGVRGEGTFWVPPTRAVWIGANAVHIGANNGVEEAINLYFNESLVPELSRNRTFVVSVDRFLREYIRRVRQLRYPHVLSKDDKALLKVLVSELARKESKELFLPESDDERLAPVLELAKTRLDSPPSLDELASTCGLSTRQLSRLFMDKLHMSFTDWFGQLRFLKSVEYLSQGEAVTNVAFDLGFEELSSFIRFFKKRTGQSPKQYLGQRKG